MRIDSGLQGYYYDQGRFKRPDLESEDTAPAAVSQPVRNPGFAPLVESSTVLSSSLSSALWALESSAGQQSPDQYPVAGATDAETADKVSAFYMEYSGDQAA